MATLGIQSKLYYNSGTFGSPTWIELSDALDVKVDSQWNLGDASSRASPVIMEEPTQLKLAITGSMLATHGTDYLVLQSRYYARTLIDVMCIDGGQTVNNSEGVRFEAKISQWAEDQAAGKVNYRDFAFTPCASANAPKSVIVTTGAPVFTSIA